MSIASGRLQQMSAVKLALLAQQLRGQENDAQALRSEPIAIVGMGCRFPGGANDPASYWRMLEAGTDAIREVPAERWDWKRFYDADPAAPGKITTRWGGFLDAIDGFDAAFFGIAPREALHMDPQQRLFLEVACEALEDAGITREQLAGSKAGVFAASYHNDYAQMIYAALPLIGAHTVTGAAHSVLANRLSYLLDLRGPSVSIDTACSSSLVALHLAAQSLREGECSLAVAGGVSLIVTPELSIALSKWGFLAEDGRCKTFDARANGFVRGEGCGAVVLKRLGDALTNGDTVLALIRGTAVNQDGRTNVMTAPSGLAQQAVVREALANSLLSPDDISYIEAHGTGTALGDPIELEALAAVVGKRSAERRLTLGSVKTNIGHLEAAAGIAGVIKVVLAMRAQALPPHLHFTASSPHFDLAASPLRLPLTLEPWRRSDAPRRAGVSSFGFGGTNAHVVLEESPVPVGGQATGEVEPPWILPVSAQSPKALRELASRYALHLEGGDASRIADVCFSASTGRDHLEQRCAAVGESAGSLIAALQAAARDDAAPGLSLGQVVPGERTDVAFVYSGQGPQWWAMGRELLAREPVFADALAACNEAMRAHAPWRLLDELTAEEGQSRLDQTAFAQPALFALQVGLTALWREWGVMPSAVAGHSVGEIAAAYAAGVLDLASAARLAVVRGRIMQAATGLGSMAALAVDAEEGERLAASSGGLLSLAAINTPGSVVLSGDTAALGAIIASLDARGVEHKLLPVNYAFHSAQMDSCRAELETALASLAPQAGKVALYSTVTGKRLDGRAMDARYWGRNLRGTVRFGPAVAAIAHDGFKLFLELAPHPVLAPAIDAVLAQQGGGTVASSLRRGRPERAAMLGALSQLYTHGAAVDWHAVQRAGQRVSLPHYPWQRSRFWVTLPAPAGVTSPDDGENHPLLGRPIESPAVAGTLFESVWSTDMPAFLAQHVVGGGAIAPATALVEMALAAAGEARTLRSVAFSEPLYLSAGPRRVQLVLSPAGDAFVLYSRPVDADAGEWSQHASGQLIPASVERPSPLAFTQARAQCERAVEPAALYAGFAELGLDFGSAFQGLTGAWFGSSVAVAQIVMPDTLLNTTGLYRFHPALLDACLQPCTELLRRNGTGLGSGEVFLPFALDSFELWTAPESGMWTHVKLRAAGGDDQVRVADIDVRDALGNAVAALHGLVLRRVQLAALGTTGDARLYRETWQGVTNAATPRSLAGTRWLLQANAPQAAQALADRLAQAQASVVIVTADEEDTLRQRVSAELGRSAWDGVIQLCGPDTARLTDFGPVSLAEGCRRSSGHALALVQCVLRSAAPATPLWLITRGARLVRQGDIVDPVQAGPWGLARAAELEHPELRWQRVDLDPSAPDDELDHVLHELSHPGSTEGEAAWRGESRLVPRLVRAEPVAAPHLAPSWRLEVTSAGSLDGLARRPVPRQEPGAGEIEIEVRAAGLNFRDVLSALGMYPGAAGPVGGECAGAVTRIGAGITGFAPGDEVMAFARASFASHVIVRAHHATPRPKGLSVAEAASTPIAFLTAIYALERLAHLRRGERVLIHAATGGVGLAAVQVAQRLGAEVFATAGSPIKRRFLERLGVRHVLDSRSLDFAPAIRRLTRGEGVHVVLNALAGEFIAASVDALAAGGRFVEMGKRDIWTAEGMRSVRADVSYFTFDLGDAADADTTLVPSLFTALSSRLTTGELRPLPVSAMSFANAGDAFRTMAQARHIGKVVLTVEAAHRLAIDPAGSYLVTGGHGALGQQVARWLAERGARHIVLTGRRLPSPEAEALMAELSGRGVRVTSAQVDVAQAADMQALWTQLDQSGIPLRGVVHSAGVLDDGVLLDQTWPQVQRVMEPKLGGALQLHQHTQGLHLDFFVLFSAGAAVLGSPGQAGYCAANLALDAVAQARRSAGLPATSIAWGPWAQGGMAAALSSHDANRWRDRGVASLSTREGLALLETAIAGDDAAVAALAMDWKRFGNDAALPRSRFDRLTRGQASSVANKPAVPGQFTARIGAALPGERRNMLAAFLQQQARAALGLDAATELDGRRPLKELGLDSLMAVELRNALTRSLGRPLPVTLLFDYPTLDGLATQLLRVLGLESGAAREIAGTAPANSENARARIEALSDADAEAQLLAELDGTPPGRSP